MESNTTNNTDTNYYSNYINGGPVNNKSNFGLSSITSTQKSKLEQLQTKLNLLSSQISSYTTKFENGSERAQKQAKINKKEDSLPNSIILLFICL